MPDIISAEGVDFATSNQVKVALCNLLGFDPDEVAAISLVAGDRDDLPATVQVIMNAKVSSVEDIADAMVENGFEELALVKIVEEQPAKPIIHRPEGLSHIGRKR